MNKKRIIYGAMDRAGKRIIFAKIQVKIFESLWLNLKTIEDTDRHYVAARAEECLSYLEDEVIND